MTGTRNDPQAPHLPVSEVLRVLAHEVGDLVEVAQALDNALSDHDKTEIDKAHLGNLQRVDSLHQHLSDIRSVLRTVADLSEGEVTIDPELLSKAARLDYVRRRLRDPLSGGEILHSNAGTVELF